MKPYQDPESKGNSVKHRTGKPCIERGCDEPAGTAWSPYWCVGHNIERMNRISKRLNTDLVIQMNDLEADATPQSP